MGCSFDRIFIEIDKEENMKAFIKIFNEELKDDIYCDEDGFLDENCFERNSNESYFALIEEEPLFNMMDNGAQFTRVVFEYLKTVPDCKFSAWYKCTFDNCNAGVYTTYEYENKMLKIVEKTSEDSCIDYCPKCDWESYNDKNLDGYALCDIEDWKKDAEYKCPKCGANIEWNVRVTKTTLKVVNSKLVEVSE